MIVYVIIKISIKSDYQKSMLTLNAFYGPRDCLATAFSFFFNNFKVKS
jgi:hypothetical protein